MRRTWGLRVGRQVERQAWPLANPVMQGLNAWDLRDWTGSGGLLPAVETPFTGFAKGFRDFPAWGWRWDTQGSVSSAAIEVPHRAGALCQIQTNLGASFTGDAAPPRARTSTIPTGATTTVSATIPPATASTDRNRTTAVGWSDQPRQRLAIPCRQRQPIAGLGTGRI